MPVLFGIPLIGWIQMILGGALVLFVLIKFLLRPKKKRTAGYLIRDVHVIVGDGSELFHQNVLIKDETIQIISSSHFLLARSLQFQNLQHFITGSHKEAGLFVSPHNGSGWCRCLLSRAVGTPNLILGTIEARVSPGPGIEAAHEIMHFLCGF